jgi:hypothetical protein
MILDERNEFADDFSAVGTAAATIVAGDVIDLGATPTLRNLGDGEEIYFILRVSSAILASGGAANVTFRLVSDSVATLDSSPTTHLTPGAIAKATLVTGYTVFKAILPHGEYERYLGVTLTPDTNDTTAGTVSAFLTKDPQSYRAYPDAVA